MHVGITGLAGSGKDEIADILVRHGIVERKYNFADPIKSILKHGLGLTDEQLYGNAKEKRFDLKEENTDRTKFEYNCRLNGIFEDRIFDELIHRLYSEMSWLNKKLLYRDTRSLSTTPRRIMQIFGTDIVRNLVSEDAWINIAPKDNVANTSIRFLNELNWLIDSSPQEYKTIFVHRPSVKQLQHQSEDLSWTRGKLLFDNYIVNDGTLHDLEDKVLACFGIVCKSRTEK